ncbi:hypothetical protein E4T50_10470 [Neofusicoccum parvum]|nr:hypothetical protein E4T50_10470 [Neofusicoccum parvum]
MSIFFRLLNHLREVGYPAHWLSDILSPLLTNTLETGARPPRTVPLALEETRQMFTNPPQPMSIAPFITELTTLASIWLPALNFGLLSGHAAIPPQTGICKYGMVFGNVETRNVYNCAHALVFVDREITFHSDVPVEHWPLREILSDDERDRRKRQPLDDRTHREGLHVLSTWTYRTEGREAAFWMREDVMRRMLAKGSWWCSIWSFDSWEMMASPVNVIREEVRDLGVWVQG